MFVHELLWPFCGSRSASLSPPPILEAFSIISFSQRVKPIRDTQRDFLDPAGYLDRLSPLGDLAKTSGRVNGISPKRVAMAKLLRAHRTALCAASEPKSDDAWRPCPCVAFDPRTAALPAHQHSTADGRRRRPMAPARTSRCRWAGLTTPRSA